MRGAPHGTLVSADAQTAGRGRQGRTWVAPTGEALLISLVLHETGALLPLIAAVAVAEAVGPAATIKWPNDILVDGRKVAGILVERRQHQTWSVLGIGVNVAVRAFPPELAQTAGSLGRTPADAEPLLAVLLTELHRWLDADDEDVVAAWNARDALRGRRVEWSDGQGTVTGIDESGRLVVAQANGRSAVLDAGEVHLR